MADQCPKGSEHRWKFNGGNPMCRKCGTYRDGYVRRVFSAHEGPDGSFEVYDVQWVPNDESESGT